MPVERKKKQLNDKANNSISTCVSGQELAYTYTLIIISINICMYICLYTYINIYNLYFVVVRR